MAATRIKRRGGGWWHPRSMRRQAWRFLPDELPHGRPLWSAVGRLAWRPGRITYADMAPYYQRAEHEIGVAGDSAL
jgi:choline dehydrogenase-like flavoprotein